MLRFCARGPHSAGPAPLRISSDPDLPATYRHVLWSQECRGRTHESWCFQKPRNEGIGFPFQGAYRFTVLLTQNSLYMVIATLSPEAIAGKRLSPLAALATNTPSSNLRISFHVLSQDRVLR